MIRLLWVRLDGPSHNDKRLRLAEIFKALIKDKKVRGSRGRCKIQTMSRF